MLLNRYPSKLINTTLKKALSMLLAVGLLCQAPLSLSDHTFAATAVQTSVTNFKTGSQYAGFQLKTQKYSEEADAQVYQFEHIKSGGKVTVFKNDDRQKRFKMLVKTPAKNNTGVNHILEHTLLSGSERFPSKNAFEIMASRTVGTEVNAYTDQAATTYEFASVNNKDFQNLYEFYLDSLFAPKIATDERLFKREGWRYELDAETGKAKYNGIVFNEIKAEATEMNEVAYYSTLKALFPNTTFANNAGGTPESIVNLKHSDVVNTWKTYYQPSNMHLLLYGDLDILPKLKLLDERYYSKKTKAVVKADYGIQKPLTAPVKKVVYYDIDAGPDLNKRTRVEISYALPKLDQVKSYILDDFAQWFNTSDNDVALDYIYEKKFSDTIVAEVSSDYQFTYMTFSGSNVETTRVDEMVTWLDGALKGLVDNGVNLNDLERYYGRHELIKKRSEISTQKGKSVMHWAEVGLMTVNNPVYHLDVDPVIETVKEEVLFNRGIETLLQQVVLNNKHKAVVVIQPKVALGEEKELQLANLADTRVKSMSPKDLTAFKTSQTQFQQWLSAPEAAAILNKMPSLTLKDVQYVTPATTLNKTTVDGIPVLKHIVKNNDISQLTYYFDSTTLTDEEQLLLPLYSELFESAETNLGSRYDFRGVIKQIMSGFDSGEVILKDDKTGEVKGKRFYVTGQVLDRDVPEAMKIYKGLFGERAFSNKAYVKNIIDSYLSNMENAFLYEGQYYANTLFKEQILSSGKLDALESEGFHQWLKQTSAQFETQYPGLIKQLEALHKKIMNKNNLTVSYVGSEAGYQSFASQIDKNNKVLSIDVLTAQPWTQTPARKNIGMVVPSKVQYIYQGFSILDQQYQLSGSDFVFSKMMNDEYAEQSIRLKGGAYGGFFGIGEGGLMSFSSYRDPNLLKSVDVFENASKWLQKRKTELNQQAIERYIVPLVASYDRPVSAFDHAHDQDYVYLSGNDPKYEEQLVREAMKTTLIDLDRFIAIVEHGMKNSVLVVVGSEEAIEQSKARFDLVRKVLE